MINDIWGQNWKALTTGPKSLRINTKAVITQRNSLVSFCLFLWHIRLRPIISLPGTDCQTVERAVGNGSLGALGRDTAALLGDLTQGASNWIQSFLDPMRTTGGARSLSSSPWRSESNATHGATQNCESNVDYPEGFEPLRSKILAFVRPTSCPIIRNPFVSPLLAPDDMLRGLPPVHIVVRKGRAYIFLKNLIYVNLNIYFHQGV